MAAGHGGYCRQHRYQQLLSPPWDTKGVVVIACKIIAWVGAFSVEFVWCVLFGRKVGNSHRHHPEVVAAAGYHVVVVCD